MSLTNNFETYLSKSRFLNLDGLRGISIILVIWHHTIDSDNISLGYGFLGVDLFFVISGFLIVTLLLRERRAKGDFSLKAFYIRRFLRIFPLYYTALFFIYMYANFMGSADIALKVSTDFPKAAVYVSNWFPMISLLGITWSLSAEEQFYFMWPCIAKLKGAFPMVILPILLLIVVGLQILHGNFGFFPNLNAFLAETSYTPILLGVGLAYLLDSKKTFDALYPILNNFFTQIAIILFLIFLSLLSVKDISGLARFGFHLSFVFLVGATVINEITPLGSFLQWKPLARIGLVSYGMYILHLLALHVILKMYKLFEIHSMVLIFFGTLFLTWGIAEISYRYYETPFLKLKDKWNPLRFKNNGSK